MINEQSHVAATTVISKVWVIVGWSASSAMGYSVNEVVIVIVCGEAST